MKHRGVEQGTPVGGEALCDTCNNARVIKGYSDTERITICDLVSEPIVVPFRVQDCSGYADKRIPPLWEMKQIAWMFLSQPVGKKAGFISAADFKKLEDENEDQRDDSS